VASRNDTEFKNNRGVFVQTLNKTFGKKSHIRNGFWSKRARQGGANTNPLGGVAVGRGLGWSECARI